MNKLLWHSNAPHTHTGYGNQTALFTPRLQKAGYEIRISGFYGREGAPAFNGDGILEYPRLIDPYMNDTLQAHYDHFGADVVFTLIDPFALNPTVMEKMAWAAWVPEDSLPMKWGNIAALQASRWQVAMSRFGEQQLKAAGFENVLYCPHGVDLDVFKPTDRRAAREKLSNLVQANLTDKYLIVNVSANKGRPSRKNFQGLIAAFAEFAHHHPPAVLYIHTDPLSPYGEDLTKMAMAFDVADKVLFPDRYAFLTGFMPPQVLNDVYNAADVMCHPALGEGFGIPIIEAQAAGCPVLVTQATAMDEVCQTGRTIPAIPIYTGSEGSWQFLPLQPEIVRALEWAYERRDDQPLRDKARQGVRAYAIDRVMERSMLPILATIFDEVQAEQTAQTDRRTRRLAKRQAARADLTP